MDSVESVFPGDTNSAVQVPEQTDLTLMFTLL